MLTNSKNESSRMRIFSICILVCMMFSGLITPTFSAEYPDYERDNAEKKVFMFYEDSSIWYDGGYYFPKDVPAGEITHLALSSIDFNEDGELLLPDKEALLSAPMFDESNWNAPGSGEIRAFQEVRMENPNMRFGISIGGSLYSGDFAKVVANSQKRERLIGELVKFITYANMDFINIDWRWPGITRDADATADIRDEGTPSGSTSDVQSYVLLLSELRAALEKLEVERQRIYEVGITMPCDETLLAQGFDLENVFKSIDFANLISCTNAQTSRDSSGHTTPLYPNVAKVHSPAISTCIDYMRTRNAELDKVLLGVAFSSTGWEKIATDGGIDGLPGLYGTACADEKVQDADKIRTQCASNGTPIVAGYGGRRAGSWSFKDFNRLKSEYPGLVEYWDDEAKVPYLYEKNGAFFSFENKQSILEKAEFVKTNGLGGLQGGNSAWDAVQTTQSSIRDTLTSSMKEGLVGTANLKRYKVSASEIAVGVHISEYSESGKQGVLIRVTNNEVVEESTDALVAMEKMAETIIHPNIYLETEHGTILANPQNLKTDCIAQGETATFFALTNETTDVSGITGVWLSQHIAEGRPAVSYEKIN